MIRTLGSADEALNRVIAKCEARKEIATAIERVKKMYLECEYDDNGNVIKVQIVDGWHDEGYGELVVGQCDKLLEELLKIDGTK